MSLNSLEINHDHFPSMSSPNFLLSGGSLGYWTACNNFKRYCTLSYCDISVWRDLVKDPVMWCHSQSPDLTSHDPTTWNTWVCVLCHLSCGYQRSCDAESLACHVGGQECILGRWTALHCPLPRNESEQAWNGYPIERCGLLSLDPSLFVFLEVPHRHYAGEPHSRSGREMCPFGKLK